MQVDVSGTLTPGNDQRIFQALPMQNDAIPQSGENGDPHFTLKVGGHSNNDMVCTSNSEEPIDPNDWIVRGLTPVECERLQGFPDGHTDLTGCDPEAVLSLMPLPEDEKARGQVERNVRKWSRRCPDGPRYKACGNSMAVPVIQWLGERIEMVDDLALELIFEEVV